MLVKLLKHDLKAIYKPLIIFYLITFSCAILTRIFAAFDSNNLTFFLKEFFKGATNGFIIGAIINNSMNIWQYFRSNFYGDRSYLTHTLPIPRSTLFLSKFFTMLITVFTTLIVSAASLFIVYASQEMFTFIRQIVDTYSLFTIIVQYLLPFVLTIYLEFVFIIQCGLVGIVIGHRAINNRTLLSIAAGFVVYTISNILTVALAMLLSCTNPDFKTALFTGSSPNPQTISFFLYAGAIVYLVYIASTCALNLHLLKRGINVD